MIGWTNDCIYKWVHNDNMVERSFVMRCAIERRGHREWTLRCCVTVSTFLSNKLFHFILNDAKSLKVASKNAIRNWDGKKKWQQHLSGEYYQQRREGNDRDGVSGFLISIYSGHQRHKLRTFFLNRDVLFFSPLNRS